MCDWLYILYIINIIYIPHDAHDARVVSITLKKQKNKYETFLARCVCVCFKLIKSNIITQSLYVSLVLSHIRATIIIASIKIYFNAFSVASCVGLNGPSPTLNTSNSG